MIILESTRFNDRSGLEIYLGDVVRADVKEPFTDMHGRWVEYEIVKAPGGYVLAYFRSEKGCLLPFGYTGCYMNDFETDDLPDLKSLIFSEKNINHPALTKVVTGIMPDDRRTLFGRK
jgi:hypothetical protein